MDCVSWADRISKVIWFKLYLISVRDFFSLVFLSSFSEGICFLHTVEKTLAYFFPVKSTYKIIRPLEPQVLSHDYSTVSLCKSSHRQYVNEWWFSNKTSIMDTEIGLAYNFTGHEMILLVILFQLFKNLKIILSSQVLPKQAVVQLWPAGHSLPTPVAEDTKSSKQCLYYINNVNFHFLKFCLPQLYLNMKIYECKFSQFC